MVMAFQYCTMWQPVLTPLGAPSTPLDPSNSDSWPHCSGLLGLPNALLGRMAARLEQEQMTMQDQSGVCLSADSNCRPPHTNAGGGGGMG